MNRVSSAPGLRAKIWGARLGRGTWKLSRFILLLGIQFVLIYPILYMVITAFRGRADMEDPSVVWLTRTWTLDNMALLVKTMNYPALLGYTKSASYRPFCRPLCAAWWATASPGSISPSSGSCSPS